MELHEPVSQAIKTGFHGRLTDFAIISRAWCNLKPHAIALHYQLRALLG